MLAPTAEPDARRLDSFSAVRDAVYERLCDREQLEPGVFPMTFREVHRQGTACGVYFRLHGPRSVTLTAVWDYQGQVLRFYGTDGARFAKMSIAASPGARPAAAPARQAA